MCPNISVIERESLILKALLSEFISVTEREGLIFKLIFSKYMFIFLQRSPLCGFDNQGILRKSLH